MFQLRKRLSIHWQCLQMNMSVIGWTLLPSLRVDDDACGDDEHDSDDINWDTRFPSWSCVIWQAWISWLAAMMSRNVPFRTGSMPGNEKSSRWSPWLWTSQPAYDFEYVVAQTMISSVEKYLCATLTTSFPYLSYAAIKQLRLFSHRVTRLELSSPWLLRRASPVQCKFSFANLQYFWLSARTCSSGLPGKKDPFVMEFREIGFVTESRWDLDEWSNKWMIKWFAMK